LSGLSEIPQRPADLTEEAAAWLAALDAGSADVAAFEAWRDADIRHAVAFAEVASNWRDMDALRALPGDLPRPAAWQPTAPPEIVDAGQPSRRHLLRVAASVTAAAAIGGGFAYRAYARDKAVTGIGQRRTVAAAPGLTLDLNTDSCVYWKGGEPARLWLARGEVAIRLAAAHRLDLMTPGGRFALSPGTYNARLRDASCELAVLAGEVSAGSASRIGSGEIGVATAGDIRIRPREAADLGRVTAWQHDTLVLNGESLDYALGEMNRYLPNKIVIGDPALSRLRIGGTFSTTDPAEFLQALRSSFSVQATVGANGGIVLTRA
jgi:transmembrane sensor